MRSPITGGRRSAIEIVRAILTVCDDGGVNKTAIMYRSNLSYDQLQRYLSLLSSQDLIQRNEEGHFQITPKGQETLQQVSTLIESFSDLRNALEPASTAVL